MSVWRHAPSCSRGSMNVALGLIHRERTPLLPFGEIVGREIQLEVEEVPDVQLVLGGRLENEAPGMSGAR